MADSGMDRQLRRIRMRRRIALGMPIAFLPFVFAISFVVHSGNVGNIVIGVYIVLFVVFAIVFGLSSCPRCHNLFFIGAWLANPVTSHCMNCGLRIDGEPD
ncbi:MAG TPA: hypothetical protein VN043_14245 [Rhodanobacter sp.]|nr:hypothetical protein [Rhodanobacter sp.]